ncbi:Gamma-interferon-inducible lysosomal thiol reductase [Aphelenchoides bicaudatus]|nr:Gamma-interferon-inducible lysosomal thiol reductase [Aphelenchoides bicaudatus]
MRWLILPLFSALLFSVATVRAANFHQSPCTLPPDFWCDHPSVAIKCTGSLKFCDSYRRTRLGKPTQIHLAFESACPDSKRFVVDRMYPKVLNNSYISQLVDFKAYPFGLAKRETAEKIACHHGERECQGNKLLSCMMSTFENDKQTRSEIFYCFMHLFNKPQDPEVVIQACMRRVGISLQVMQTIIACAKSQKATSLQRFDEVETRKILSQPRFVPFIQINEHSHIDMQAYQMIMPEKLHAWSSTLQRRIVPSTDNSIGGCGMMPEFWCSSPAITNQCFHSAGCKQYANAIYGQPIHLKVVYSDSAASRNYVLGYIKRNFLLNSASNKANQDKVVVELEPAASAQNPCGETSCDYQAVQHCVQTHVKDVHTRNQMLLCLLEAGGDMLDGWATRCHTFKPQYKDIVMQCAKSPAWRQEVQQHAKAQASMFPEPAHSAPWVVVNGYSLSSVQQFQNLLHRLICLWYRGPNHNRQACARCEYEMTHCMGK